MDQRIITLTSLIPTISLEDYSEINISRKFNHLCVLSKSGVLSVYLISRNVDSVQRRIWRSSNQVGSFAFSDDGNYVTIIYKEHFGDVYQISSSKMELLYNLETSVFTELFSSCQIEEEEMKTISVLSCVKNDIVLFINKTYLLYLTWNNPEGLKLHKKVNTPSCTYVTRSRDYIFILTVGGNISIHSIENALLLGSFNIYTVLQKNNEELKVPIAITATADGRKLAVIDENNNVLIVNTEKFLRLRNQQEEMSNCSMSVASMYSRTSVISKSAVSLHRSSLIRDDAVSLNVTQGSKQDKSYSYRSVWKSYLNVLGMKTQHGSGFLPGGRSSLSSEKRIDASEVKLITLPKLHADMCTRFFHLSDVGINTWSTLFSAPFGGVFKTFDINLGVCTAEIDVPDDTVVIPGGFMGYMDAFLCSNKLSMYLGNITRDAFINKMMQCMDTESIGQLLQSEEWKDLFVPLSALSESLRQHQMDVARLAFGLHSQAFKNTFNESSTEPAMFMNKLNNLTRNMNDLFDTVESAVAENIKNVAFSSQLIILSLNHAYELLNFLHNKIYNERRDSEALRIIDKNVLRDIVKEIMHHVLKLRSKLSRYPNEQTNSVNDYQPLDNLSDDSDLMWQKWSTMNDEDVVLDSVSRNILPLAQTYLIVKHSWKPQGIMNRIKGIVNRKIHQLLQDKDITESIKLLTNVGYTAQEELKNIFRLSTEKKVRDNIAAYLTEHHYMNELEIEAWKFLLLLEDYLEHIHISGTSEFIYGETIKRQTQADAQHIVGTHLKLTVDVILKQSSEWKSLVLTEIFFNVPGTNLQEYIHPEIAWKYLLCNNRDDILICWIDTYYTNGNPSEEVCDCLNVWESSMKDLSYQMERENMDILTAAEVVRLFASLQISQTMIDSVKSEDSMQITKDLILDHFSRYGIFDSHEKLSITSILKRLARSSSLQRLEDVVSKPTANINLNDVQTLLTEYILKYKLYQLPFLYLKDCKYTEEQVQKLCDTFPDDASSELHWFRLWLAFREYNSDAVDDSVIYDVILKAAQYLSNSDMQKYLKEHPLVVIALVIFSGKSLTDVYAKGELENSPVTKEVFMSALEKLPLLEISLISLQKREQEPDITVYELLQDCTPFDTQKIFAFQENGAIDLPHFSMPKLVSKYGYKCSLDYIYYLKQGRPSFAANTFFVEQYKRSEKLSKRMLKEASGYAHGVALQNFRDTCITSACVSFSEMLGVNSDAMRVNISAANKIVNYLISQNQNSAANNELFVEEVALLLQGLTVKNPQAPSEILSLLQSALLHELSVPSCDIGHEEDVVRSMIQWDLAVKFAKLHKIKLPDLFLVECAKKDLWLPFLMFIDMHQYPVSQVLDLIKHFKSTALREHLRHAIESNISAKTPEKSIEKKLSQDSRKQFYDKIGFRKGQKKVIDFHGSSPDTWSSSSEDLVSSAPMDTANSEVSEKTYSDNLLLVLLQCHNSPDPPRALLSASLSLQNPVLSVFANCYEPSSLIACFCTWLLASLPPSKVTSLSSKLDSALQQQLWSHVEMELVMVETVRTGFVSTLERGIKLFLSDNPLCTFSTFLTQCVKKQDFSSNLPDLQLFKEKCLLFSNNASPKDFEIEDDSFINNAHWLVKISLQLIAVAAMNCFRSSFSRQQFLKTLCDVGFSEDLPDAPDFQHILDILLCLSDSNIQPDLEILCSPNTEEHKEELQRCVNELLEAKLHQKALNLTAITSLPKDDIHTAQCLYEYSKLQPTENFEEIAVEFWKKWSVTFSDEQVNKRKVAEFFHQCSENTKSQKERYCTLHLSLIWYQKERNDCGSVNRQTENAVEFEMWLCWLPLDDDSKILIQCPSGKNLCIMKAELLHISGVDEIQHTKTLETIEEKLKLDSVIGNLLDQGDLPSCCRLEKFFNHKNQDLQIMLVCMDLAEEQLTPYQLPPEYRMLLNAEPSRNVAAGYKRRTAKALRLSSVSSTSHSLLNYSLSFDQPNDSQKERYDTLSLLEKLAECVEHGKNYVGRIVSCYRLSLNLDLTYKHIISLEDPMVLLKHVIENDTTNKLVIINDLIYSAGLNEEEIAELLCSEIVGAITRQYLQGDTDHADTTKIWGYGMDENFHVILELCDDPSILGSKLLEVSNTFGSTQGETIHKVHAVIIELVIRAHDCFTAACDMQGISSILRKSRILTTSLLKKEEWPLMVRLLTGVGRYTEMNYIFQILKENEHFELLLGKGLDKVRGLKVALLDFLRQFCPQDKDLFRLVALHFSMYSDAANLWEADGEETVDKVLNSAKNDLYLNNTADVKDLLQKAIINFSDAAQYYLKANKLTKAMAIAHKAQLVALQISLFNAAPSAQFVDLLLNFKAAEVSKVIINKLSFPQACIVARAYSHPTDWGAALYQHCIVNREPNYLSDFVHNMTLTTALVEDVARRFQMDPNITQEMAQEMKKFVLRASNVEVKYRVASQLGFKDIIQNLLSGPEVAYLKDTIWRKGFRGHQTLQ